MSLANIVSTAEPAGRPRKIERPSWHGTALEHPADSPYSVAQRLSEGQKRRSPVLPPRHTEQSFMNAYRDLQRLLGEEHVDLNDVVLVDGDYHAVPLSHDQFHILSRDDFQPSAVCYPGSTEEVSEVVKWANRHNVPIWPISIGRNLGYGGAAPRVRGSVVLDLGRRMNRVLDVSEKFAACLVEPGVQYLTLYEHLHELGLGDKLWIDVPDLPGGSVMGNALDRGVGYTPLGDHFGSSCGMEVVLANGDVVRTGMGAMPGSDCWQLFPYGFGPHHAGLFTQSNFGIVTKMGFWLMANPGGIRPFQATFPREDNLAQAVGLLRPLMVQKVIGNVPCLRLGLQDAMLYKRKAEFECDERGLLKKDKAQKHLDELGTGAWVFYGTLYGPDELTQPKFEYIAKELTKIPGARVLQRKDVPADSYLHDYARFTAGIPTWREMERMKWIDNAAHLFFAPISAIDGADATRQMKMCRSRLEEYSFDYFGTFFIGHREMHHVVSIMYDRNNDEEKRRALAAIRALIDDCAKVGVGEYRTHLALQDQVAGTYNWGEGAMMRFNETLKDALDPNGILQPGRSGIWPQAYRNKGWELRGGEERSDSNVKQLAEDPGVALL